MSDFPNGPPEEYLLVSGPDKVLGAGKFGVVKKVTRKSDQKVFACKSIRLQGTDHSKAIAEREYTLLAPVTHPNIVKYVGISWLPHKVKIYMEYCSSGSLQDLIKVKKTNRDAIPETFVWDVLFQLSAALVYCHHGLSVTQKGSIESSAIDETAWEPILHRDIKPSNVLLSSLSGDKFDTVKLGDFGLGTTLTEETYPSTYVGSPQYMAPEISRLRPSAIRWTKKCDIFSLGCTLYALCTYEPPFEWHMETEQDTFDAIPDRYSQKLKKCIADCLSFNSELRPDPIDLLQRAKRYISSGLYSVDPVAIAKAEPDQSGNIKVEKEPPRGIDAVSEVVEKLAPISSEITPLSTSQLTIRVHWNLRRTLRGHSDRVRSVAFSPDGRQIASASADYTVRLWDSATGAELRTLKGHSKWIKPVAFSPDGRQIASASDNRTVRLWDSATGWALRNLKGYSEEVLSVAFSPDGRQIASASNDRTVWLWDSATGAELRTLKGHSGWVLSVAFSPDGRQIASSGDRTIRLWDSATGAALRKLKGHSRVGFGVAFSPDGRQIASASSDCTVRLWDAATGAELRTLKGGANGVAFSPDGRQIASASSACTVRLWDAATGAELRTLKGHSSVVNGVAFSPDGRQIASASGYFNCTVRLWDSTTGAELRTLEGHSGSVNGVAFSPDGRQIASASDDCTVRLWDSCTGGSSYEEESGCQVPYLTEFFR